MNKLKYLLSGKAFRGYEFWMFVAICVWDAMSLTIWKDFDTQAKQVWAYYFFESIRTLTLYYFVYYLISTNPFKDKDIQEPLSALSYSMVWYALMYAVKEGMDINNVGWLDYVVWGLTIVVMVLKYFKVGKMISRYKRLR